MTTVLSADGLIEIPEAFRKADSLKPGQRCDIERVGEGREVAALPRWGASGLAWGKRQRAAAVRSHMKT